MISNTAVAAIGACLVFGALLIAAAVRPAFLMGYWRLVRIGLWATTAYFCASCILSSLSVLLHLQTIVQWSNGNDMLPAAKIVPGIAVVLGVVTLVARFVGGAHNVPWFFGESVDRNIFWGAIGTTFWLWVSLIQWGVDFFGVERFGYGLKLSEKILGYGVAYGFTALIVAGLLISLREQRKWREAARSKPV